MEENGQISGETLGVVRNEGSKRERKRALSEMKGHKEKFGSWRSIGGYSQRERVQRAQTELFPLEFPNAKIQGTFLGVILCQKCVREEW